MSRMAHRLVGPLWVVWFGLLFGGMVLNSQEHIGSGGFLTSTRLSSSFVLVLAAWLWAAGAVDARVCYPLLGLAVGMSLGFLGDVSNAGLILPDGKQALLGGALAFGLGHVAYIWASFRTRRDMEWKHALSWWGSILTWQVIGLAGWFAVVQPIEPKVAIHWVSLPYCLLLAGTAGVTTGLALADKRFSLLALGGAVFLASDLVLAMQNLRYDIKIKEILTNWTGWTSGLGSQLIGEVSRNAVWLLYGPAQMLIVYSAASFLKVYRDRPSISQSNEVST